MSLYYEFSMAFDMRPNTPQQVIDTLHHMTRSSLDELDNPPEHFFFKGNKWRNMLQPHSGDPRFPGEFGSALRKAYRYTQFGVDVYRHTLCFRCCLLDDDFYDIWWGFCQWIAPHCESVGCVGYYREQSEWQPTLVYFRDEKVYVCQVQQTPVEIHDGTPW